MSPRPAGSAPRELATPVRPEWRQVVIDERSAHLAAVTADHEGPALGAYPHGLMTGGVPGGHQAADGSVAEELVAARAFEAVMPAVDVVWVVGPGAMATNG